MRMLKAQECPDATILFIHGNSSSSAVFRSCLSCPRIEHKMIAVDLLGHGANNKSDYSVHDLTMEAQKDFLLKEIDTIGGPIFLVGNSLGGHLAIESAPEIENLAGLVIFGTPPFRKPINPEEAFLPLESLQTFLTAYPDMAAIETVAKIAVANPEVVSVIVSDFKAANPLIRTAFADDIMGDRLSDEWGIFTNLKVPKYIIKGDKDPSVNPDYLKAIVKACSNNCELIMIENCGHYPSLERPEEFNKVLFKIIAEVF